MVKRLTIELLVMIALGLLIGLLGPFGTFDAPPAQRMVSWAVWLLAGYMLFRPTGVVANWLCEATGLPRFAGKLLAIAVAGVPLTLIITMMATRLNFAETLGWSGFWTMYLYICVISAVAFITMAALFGRTDTAADVLTPPPVAQPKQEAPPLAIAALPLPPGFGPIRALKGEDHYVRVIADGREELILMRMRDAIDRLGDAQGLRVHRSWWVARGAVAAVRRDGRTAVLILTGGHEVPVARDMMPQLRTAGWL